MRRQAGNTLKFPRYHSNCSSRVFGGITENDDLKTNQGMSFENEGKLSLCPQCILENMMVMVMMTSLLADKSVMLKLKIIMNFMNEIINPPCNSLLATFFEAIRKVCPKTVSSSLRRSIRPKWTINQLFKLLFPLPLLLSPKKILLKREARRVLWEVWRDQLK